MRLLAVIALIILCVAATAPRAAFSEAAAQAEQQKPLDKGKLLVPRRKADGAVSQTAFFEDPVQWLREQQQEAYGGLNRAVNALKADPWGPALWTLLAGGFLYGVFHAAGPGHGKAVISAWLLATENELKRGIFIAFLSAFIQALVAILLVGGLFLVFGAAANASARDVAGVLESLSYAMIGLMGLYLIWTALRGPGRDHAHAHAPVAHLTDHHHHHHDHGDHSACGHAHAPAPQDVRGDWSLTKAFALAFSVGLRPCLGAVLILLFAIPAGLMLQAVGAVFAMAFGTFLTVSAIAALSVYGKALALSLAKRDGRFAAQLETALRFGGGVVVAAFGGLLFWASLGTPTGMS